MKVQWKLESSYTNGACFVTDIDNYDLRGLSDEEKDQFIDECVQDDFDQIVSFHITKVEE